MAALFMATQVSPDVSARHKLKPSPPEIASLICEMEMKSPFMWQFNKPAFVQVVCPGKAIQLCKEQGRMVVSLMSGHCETFAP